MAYYQDLMNNIRQNWQKGDGITANDLCWLARAVDFVENTVCFIGRLYSPDNYNQIYIIPQDIYAPHEIIQNISAGRKLRIVRAQLQYAPDNNNHAPTLSVGETYANSNNEKTVWFYPTTSPNSGDDYILTDSTDIEDVIIGGWETRDTGSPLYFHSSHIKKIILYFEPANINKPIAGAVKYNWQVGDPLHASEFNKFAEIVNSKAVYGDTLPLLVDSDTLTQSYLNALGGRLFAIISDMLQSYNYANP